MSRPGAVTFKGNPLTLAGEAVKVGSQAPDFKLHYFEGGLKTITPADLKGKPTILSVKDRTHWNAGCAIPALHPHRSRRRTLRQVRRSRT